jgi:hypothetical protein
MACIKDLLAVANVHSVQYLAAVVGVNVVQQAQLTVAYALKVVKAVYRSVWIQSRRIAVSEQAISAEQAWALHTTCAIRVIVPAV